MKTSKRFNNAIDALVKAYLNDTLAKGNTCACAIGNMIAHSMGRKVMEDPDPDYMFTWGNACPRWQDVFSTRGNGAQCISVTDYRGEAKRQIDATEYAWQELARIEKAFENATSIHYAARQRYTPAEIDADQYNGLMAVVDVLCEIEGIADSTEYKALFAKPCPA